MMVTTSSLALRCDSNGVTMAGDEVVPFAIVANIAKQASRRMAHRPVLAGTDGENRDGVMRGFRDARAC